MLSLLIVTLRIERRRWLKQHSVTLTEKALEPWLEKFYTYYTIASVSGPSGESHRRAEDPVDIEFFTQLKEHLKSGYSGLYEAWNCLKCDISNHNKEDGSLREKLRSLALKELKIPDVEERPRDPKRYMYSHRYASSIIYELAARVFRGQTYRLTVESPGIAKEEVWKLIYGDSQLIISPHKAETGEGRDFFKRILESQELKSEVKRLGEKAKKLTERREELVMRIRREILTPVKLGGVLRGCCEVCSILRISRRLIERKAKKGREI